MRFHLAEDWPALLIVAAAGLMSVPLWCVDIPAMPDYPAHLASFWLISGAPSAYYFIQWAAVPNLAFEVMVPLLAPFFGIGGATKLLLSVALALWVLAPALVHRALYGKVGLAPLGAVFFAYNVNFMWGFFNYVLASGLALALFAGWIASAAWRRNMRLPLFAFAVLAVYFCHLFGAALLLFLIGCYELAVFWRTGRRDLRNAFACVWPLVVIALPSAVAYVFLKPRGAVGAEILFNLGDSFRDRFESPVATSFDQPDFVALGALALFFVIGIWRKWLSVHPDLRLALLALLVLVLVMPEQGFGGWGLDLRLPPVLGAMTFASATIHLPFRTRAVLSGFASAALVFSVAALAGNWRYYDVQFREFRAALMSLPKGVKLVTVLDGDAIGLAADEPYWHLAEFAVMERDGFAPLLFTTKGQHVVRLRPGLEKVAAQTAMQGSPPDISELDDLAAGNVDGDDDIAHVFPYLMYFQCTYDDVALIHLGGNRSPVPAMLKLRHAGTFFSLYDTKRTGCPAT